MQVSKTQNNNDEEILVKLSIQETKHIISALVKTHAKGKELHVAGELECRLNDIVDYIRKS